MADHVCVGGLYYHTGITIAGFQSRVGCLFFLVSVPQKLLRTFLTHMRVRQGALIAFSSLSALYNVVEIRPLFLRERSASYYRSVLPKLWVIRSLTFENSPTAWLLSRFAFDVLPLRIIPTIIVATMYVFSTLPNGAKH